MVRRSQEQFLTEIATVNYIFGTYSLPFLNQITKSGATYKFLRALVYTPQEPAATATPFVSTTGLLTGTGSPFVATISTKVPPLLAPAQRHCKCVPALMSFYMRRPDRSCSFSSSACCRALLQTGLYAASTHKPAGFACHSTAPAAGHGRSAERALAGYVDTTSFQAGTIWLCVCAQPSCHLVA